MRRWPSRSGRGDARAQRARRAAGAAAEVADRADRGVAALVEGIGQFAAIRGKRVKSFDLEGFASLRDSFIGRGYRWPAWCFLPAPLVGAGLGEELAVDVNPALISPATMLACLAAAWTPGRIAARFDDDVAQALIDTPMEASIPTEVLQRLPAWGLYVDCPRLGAGAGFFVTLDAGTVTGPGGQGYTELDELLVAVVRGYDDAPPLVISSLWLRPSATIGESLAEQAGQTQRLGPNFGEAGERSGWRPSGWAGSRRRPASCPWCCTCARTPQTSPAARSLRRLRLDGREAGAETVGMSVGFRLGTALRLAAAEHASAAGDGTGHRVAPHLRRAHWHHFWAGSETRDDRHDRSKHLARALAAEMARTHLLAGFDVVVPQLLAHAEFIEGLNDVASRAGAEFHEILLLATGERTIARFRARRAATEAARVRHPQGTADHDVETIAAIAAELELMAKTRANTRVIDVETGGPDAAYRALRSLVDRPSPAPL